MAIKECEEQIGLSEQFPELNDANEKRYAAAFKALYYHLYSNSNSSRAERIITDLSNLLLCKIASESNGNRQAITQFLNCEGTANELLLPLLLHQYPTITGLEDSFSLGDEVLRKGLRQLAALSFRSTPAHVLGEAFQAVMGPRLRGDKGQFFTPRSLVRAMIEVLAPGSNSRIVDPACGTAGFLVEAHAYRQNRGSWGEAGRLLGIDKDRDLCRLAEAALEVVAPGRGCVVNGNSLDIDLLDKLPAEQRPFEADFVITNPPFGAKIKITEPRILRQFALGHEWRCNGERWVQQGNLKAAQDPQVLFIELCVRLLKAGGMAGIVLPEGVFGNEGLGYVWDFVREHGSIIALLDCPRTTFQPSTDTKTNVFFFRRNDDSPGGAAGEKVWTAVALSCGHDRRGRYTTSTGQPYPNQLREIGQAYGTPRRNEHWQLTDITNPYYLVPRFYDRTAVEELEFEAKKLRAELISIGEMVESGFLYVRKGQEVGAEAYGSGDIPFIRTSDIANYEISIDPTRGVSEEIFQQYGDQQNLRPGDILLVCDGRYRIGRTAMVTEHNHRAIVQSHIRIITTTKTSPISSIELLYLLNMGPVQHQLRNMVFIQSTLGNLGSRFNQIRIPIPSRTEEWLLKVNKFKSLIEGRAELLQQLKTFEDCVYEL